MSEINQQETPPENNLQVPAPIASFARLWNNISSSLVPFLAVVTAFLFGIPLIMATAGLDNPARGLVISGQAYAALVEGLTGIAVSDVADFNDFRPLRQYDEALELGEPGRRLGIEAIDILGLSQVQAYRDVISSYDNLTGSNIDDIVAVLPNINDMADDLEQDAILSNLSDISTFMDGEFVNALAGAPDEPLRGRDAREKTEIFDELVSLGADQTELAEDDLAAAIEFLPLIEEMTDEQFSQMLIYLTLFDDYGFEVVDLRGARSITVSGVDPFDEDLTATLRDIEENNATDAIVERASTEKWGLYKLNPSYTSLESIFMQLTQPGYEQTKMTDEASDE